jgi:hypothetical protein
MISPTLGVDQPTLIAAIALLFIFGCGYAYLVYGLGERKFGYVALFVVAGVLVTLGVEAVLDLRAAVLSLVLFAASGAPMVAGEIIQHMRARDRTIQNYQEQARTELSGR